MKSYLQNQLLSNANLEKLILIYLQSNLEKLSDNDFTDLMEVLRTLSEEKITHFVNAIIFNPKLANIIMPHISKLIEIIIRRDGFSKDNWSPFAKIIFSKIELPDIQQRRSSVISNFLSSWKKERRKLKKAIEDQRQVHDFEESIKNILDKNKCKFLRIQGRTILFESKNKILAIKIQKKNESIVELHKQKYTVIFLNQNKEKLKLQSQYPTPLAIAKIDDINEFLIQLEKNQKQSEEMAELKNNIIIHNNDFIFAYIYQFEEKSEFRKNDYFTYVHDPRSTPEQFFEAMKRGINDILILFKNGMIYDQLADIFHDEKLITETRIDHGKFLALSNLVLNNSFGSGRIENYRTAVQFVNLRVSGAADEGDFHKLETFTKKEGKYAKKFIKPEREAHITAELLAQILLVMELTTIEYALRSIENDKNKDTLIFWENLGKQLLNLYHFAFSLLSGFPESMVKDFFNDKVWNPLRYAKQMYYFMTDHCVNDILKGKIQSGIFSDETLAHAIPYQYFEDSDFYDYLLSGFIDYGKRGPHSTPGPHLIKEGDFIRYSFVTFLFSTVKIVDEFKANLRQGKNLALEGKRDEAKSYFSKAQDIHPKMFKHFKNKIENKNTEKEEKYSLYRNLLRKRGIS